MRRREFIGLVGGVAAAWAVVARAQPQHVISKMEKIVKLSASLSLAAIVVLMPIAAESQQRYFASAKAFGPIEFSADGSKVTGVYPEQKGRLYGEIIAPGVVQGHWFEPKSDQPCQSARNGTNAWGTLIITDYGTRKMSGFWGYCDTKPSRPFNFQF